MTRAVQAVCRTSATFAVSLPTGASNITHRLIKVTWPLTLMAFKVYACYFSTVFISDFTNVDFIFEIGSNCYYSYCTHTAYVHLHGKGVSKMAFHYWHKIQHGFLNSIIFSRMISVGRNVQAQL